MYVGNAEFISIDGLPSEVQRHIDGMAIEIDYLVTGIRKLQYLHKDHLGSIDVITDDVGKIIQKFS